MKNFIVKSAVFCAVILSFFVLRAAEVPSKFKEFESVTVQAKDFKRISAFAKLGLESVDDPDAAGGKTAVPKSKPDEHTSR